ncbi:hypothetical protein [Phaeobacter sp. JH209A]|uniref:hypothetical protein n=1 Tax=Phaeobacter sp. JH209A TaxID=3112505 RepID=UPI003A835603
MTWGKFIIGAWGVVLALSLMTSALPASWWFEAGELRVADASAGECPEMQFDREINRPFKAAWIATIMRRASYGWATYRTFQGTNDYRPENQLPDKLDLCWWTWADPLHMPPGEYRVNTLWRIHPTQGRAREVRRTSNTFTISGG